MSTRDIHGNASNFGNHNRGVIVNLATERGTELTERLRPALDSAYNAGPRAHLTCFEGTRVEIVEKIIQWADNPSDCRMAWLHGPAGFGKSALTRKLADLWDRNKQLIGSYFFFRNTEQSVAARLIPTLAFNLTISMPETKPAIEKALRDDPALLHLKVEDQFLKLIVEPIAASPKRPPANRVIALDGLDECEDKEFIARLVKVIASTPFSQLPVLFFFTSRMEDDIRKTFHLATTKAVTHSLSLLDFNAGQDIELFLKAQFESIHDDNPRLMGHISRPWPTSSDLEQIVKLVDGSFVFAATLAEYVRGGKPPPERLIPIVKENTGVDGMYREILARFWKNHRFQTVFSTLMLLREPLSVTGLQSLLLFSVADILSDILDIQSIIIVPDDDSTKVQIVHTSLRDFSTSLQRSQALCVNTAERQLRLTIHCLQVMSTQALEGSGIFEEDAAKYAALHWLKHLQALLQAQGSLTVAQYNSLIENLEGFKLQTFDTWANTVMWFSGTNRHTDTLGAIAQKVKEVPNFPRKVIMTLKRTKDLLEVVRPALF